jgi:hypothetical protein
MESLIVESTEQLEIAFPNEKSGTKELIELTVEQLCDVGGGTTYVLY